MDTFPIRTLSTALQDAFEALNDLAETVPAHNREKYQATVNRLARARIKLDTWCEEQR